MHSTIFLVSLFAFSIGAFVLVAARCVCCIYGATWQAIAKRMVSSANRRRIMLKHTYGTIGQAKAFRAYAFLSIC